MAPACNMKLTPFALLSLSSAGATPSTMLGELSASSGVKYHCLARGRDALVGEGWVGDDAPRRDWGGREDVREECVGGEGTAGGTSRRLEGDLEGRAETTGFGGRDGG